MHRILLLSTLVVFSTARPGIIQGHAPIAAHIPPATSHQIRSDLISPGVAVSTVTGTAQGVALAQYAAPRVTLSTPVVSTIASSPSVAVASSLDIRGLNIGAHGGVIGGLGVNTLGVHGLGANELGINGLSINGLGVNGYGVNGINGYSVSGINGYGANAYGANGYGVNGYGVNGLGVSSGLIGGHGY